LRPQAGKSPWRPLYRKVGDRFVIAAVGPEAKKNKRGFDKACERAIDRLAKLEGDDGEQEAEQGRNETETQPQKVRSKNLRTGTGTGSIELTW